MFLFVLRNVGELLLLLMNDEAAMPQILRASLLNFSDCFIMNLTIRDISSADISTRLNDWRGCIEHSGFDFFPENAVMDSKCIHFGVLTIICVWG